MAGREVNPNLQVLENTLFRGKNDLKAAKQF
jgi:hypothetical protein